MDINHTQCIRSEVINLSKAHNKKYTQMYNPKEQLRFAIIIGKDQCSLISQAKAYLRLLQYDYQSWGVSYKSHSYGRQLSVTKDWNVEQWLTNHVEALKTEFTRLKCCKPMPEPSYSLGLPFLCTLERSGNHTDQTVHGYLVAKGVYTFRQIGIYLYFPQLTDSKFGI